MRALLAALLAAVLVAATPAGSTPAPITAAARNAWGFDRSDLTPHPRVRFGVLGNGMRYAVMANAVPAGALSVRLRFDVGALDEGERELGFAHIIEHMIFHGTENVPEGSLPMMLAQRGLKRWTDFNAFTSYDETLYRLDLRQSDGAARETALVLMREIAGNLVFTRRTVTGAKRKVREEIDSRDAIQDRIATAQNALIAPGTRIARGPVAGTKASVGRADPRALLDLYKGSYVPGRATLVIVGDFDPAAVEAEVASRFSDWQTPAAPRPRALLPAIGIRGPESSLLVDGDAPTTVMIATAAALAAGGDTGGRRDSGFLERMGSGMLERRLARITAAPDAPFLSASSEIYDHFSTARVASIDLAARNRDWRGALVRAERELRCALDAGFSEPELAEQSASIRRALVPAPASRTTPALADAIVDAAGRGIVFTEPADPAATADYVSRVRLADVNAAFSAAWSGPRLIFISHHRRIAAGEIAAARAQAPTCKPL